MEKPLPPLEPSQCLKAAFCVLFFIAAVCRPGGLNRRIVLLCEVRTWLGQEELVTRVAVLHAWQSRCLERCFEEGLRCRWNEQHVVSRGQCCKVRYLQRSSLWCVVVEQLQKKHHPYSH